MSMHASPAAWHEDCERVSFVPIDAFTWGERNVSLRVGHSVCQRLREVGSRLCSTFPGNPRRCRTHRGPAKHPHCMLVRTICTACCKNSWRPKSTAHAFICWSALPKTCHSRTDCLYIRSFGDSSSVEKCRAQVLIICLTLLLLEVYIGITIITSGRKTTIAVRIRGMTGT